MPIIRVDPDDLDNKAQRLRAISDSLASLARDISAAGQSAPSYDGQFGPRVNDLAAGPASGVSSAAGRVGEFASRLNGTAARFRDADLAGSAGIAAVSASLAAWMSTGPGLTASSVFSRSPFAVLSSLSNSFLFQPPAAVLIRAASRWAPLGGTFVRLGLTAGRIIGGIEFRRRERELDRTFQRWARTSGPDATYTRRLGLDTEITVPVAFLGGSPVAVKGRELALQRQGDGSYLVTLGRGGGLGLAWAAAEAKGSVRIRGQEKGTGLDASADIVVRHVDSTTFVFDPGRPGDMTKMVGLMSLASVAAVGSTDIDEAADLLFASNVVGAQEGNVVAAEGEVSAGTVMTLLEAKGEIDYSSISGWGANALGQREIYKDAQVESSIAPVILGLTIPATVSLSTKHVTNEVTGREFTVVTRTITSQGGLSFSFEDVGKLLGKTAGSFGVSAPDVQSAAVEVTYEIDGSADIDNTQLLLGGQQEWSRLYDSASSVKVVEVSAEDGSIDFSASGAATNQKLGLNLDTTQSSETRRVVWGLCK